MKPTQRTCTLCSESLCGLKIKTAVAVDEDIEELLMHLNTNMDINILRGSIICKACLDKINMACELKVLILESECTEEESNEINSENMSCYICKGFVTLEASTPLLDSPYVEDLKRYLFSKENSVSLDESRICNMCRNLLLNFHIIMHLLSKFEKGKLEMVGMDIFSEDGVNQVLEQDVKMEIEENSVDEGSTKQGQNVHENGKESVDINNNKDIEIVIARKFQTKTELKAFKCKICGYCTKRKSILERLHLLSHSNNDEVKRFKCDICEFQSKYKRSLQHHMINKHQNKNQLKMYKCKQCEFGSHIKGSLTRHMLTHKNINEINIFKCNDCDFQTKHKNCLCQHIMRVHNNCNRYKEFKCKQCKFRTRRENIFRSHLCTPKDTNKIEIFKCKICNFETKYTTSFKLHMSNHKGLKQFKCDQCVYQASQKCLLKQHILRHHTKVQNILRPDKKYEETKILKCNFCDYQTTFKNDFTEHVNTHNCFKCEQCEYHTLIKRSLERHLVVHKNFNETKTFICDICNFQTKYRQSFTQHIKTTKNHNRAKKLKCDMCQFETNHKRSLKDHKSRMHKQQNLQKPWILKFLTVKLFSLEGGNSG